MKNKIFILLIFTNALTYSQSISLNESFLTDFLRIEQNLGNFNQDISFTVRPIDLNKYNFKNDSISDLFSSIYKDLYSSKNNKIKLKILPFNLNSEYSSQHPYNRNNGSLIGSRGYQQISSIGLFLKIGPFELQFKPEHVFSENRDFEGFWDGHYDVIWAKRYQLWNKIDMPERFGVEQLNLSYSGQSYARLNFNKLSIGISSENLWWGPSKRNSIMMSNHAKGFDHISFRTNSPLKTTLGDLEFQFVTGKLKPSNHVPPQIDRTFAGTKLYIEKVNQNGKKLDWRFFQGIVITFSPKQIKGLSLGFIKWTQMYSALIKGEYWWMDGRTNYFPLFSNLFRSNDKNVDYEAQTDQAAGLFFRWNFPKTKFEIYSEFHYNDAKYNFRDLLLDSDHARAITAGLSKIFETKYGKMLFEWEWTQLEQTGGRILRNAGSWYAHSWVTGGYTNRGEVIGAAIGPGSNSHYFGLKKINKLNSFGIGLEVVDQDNDFYYYAFESAKDYRRYWKDFNFNAFYQKEFNKSILSFNLVFQRSLNYQWELDDYAEPYYHAGRDKNNLHLNLKLLIFPFK